MIPAAHIRGILESLKNNLSFDEDPEITIEMNPKTVNEEKIEIYLSSGINRFSAAIPTSRRMASNIGTRFFSSFVIECLEGFFM